MKLSRKQSNLLFIALLIVVLLIGWGAYTFVDRLGKQKVDIITAPQDATIYIEDVKTSSSTTYLAKGSYNLRVESEGFKTVEKTITVDDEGFKVGMSLVPVSDEAKKWAEDHPEQYSEEFDEPENPDPILGRLPYKNLLYSLEKLSDGDSTPIRIKMLTIKGYRNAPIDYIKRFNADPSNYIYEYNYKDPLK